MSRADLLLHPIRLRIAQVLSGGGHLTAQQIARALPEASQASLYRHLSLLTEGKVVAVVAERQVPHRNLVEKVYALDLQAATLHTEDARNASKEDHRRYFTLFLLMLLADFDRYLEHTDRVDTLFDEVEYRHNTLYLSDEEARRLLAEVNAILAAAQTSQPL